MVDIKKRPPRDNGTFLSRPRVEEEAKGKLQRRRSCASRSLFMTTEYRINRIFCPVYGLLVTMF